MLSYPRRIRKYLYVTYEKEFTGPGQKVWWGTGIAFVEIAKERRVGGRGIGAVLNCTLRSKMEGWAMLL